MAPAPGWSSSQHQWTTPGGPGYPGGTESISPFLPPPGYQPGGFETGAVQPGGFETGAFQPGGFETGSFETGAVQPAGFEPGGFETGSFEPSRGAGLADASGPIAGGRSVSVGGPIPARSPKPSKAVRIEPQPVQPQLADDDELEEQASDGTYRGAVVAALVWCAIPVVFYIGWALLLAGNAEAGCFDDNGEPCVSPRIVAWNDLLYAAPLIIGVAVLSSLVALALRKITTGWRSTTVGFASAVVASGAITVVWTAIARGG